MTHFKAEPKHVHHDRVTFGHWEHCSEPIEVHEVTVEPGGDADFDTIAFCLSKHAAATVAKALKLYLKQGGKL